MVELNTLQDAVYSLVKRYASRQNTVLEAMGDLRPDLLLLAKGGGVVEELIQMTKLYSAVPQSGQWGKNKEWHYFIHGKGCQLIHNTTQEPLEWDAPDIESFDRSWFVNYLQWLSSQGVEDEYVAVIMSQLNSRNSILQDVIYNTLNQLQQLGILTSSNASNPNKLTLTQ